MAVCRGREGLRGMRRGRRSSLYRFTVGFSSRKGGRGGVVGLVGAFDSKERPRAKRGANRVARTVPRDTPAGRRGASGLDGAARTTSHGAAVGAAGCFRLSSARGGTGTERSAERALKWCEWRRVSRRLECPVRAGDGPCERTNELIL